MSKTRKKYNKTEKIEIVTLSLETSESVSSIAERYGINQGTLYNWRSAYLKDKEACFPGNGNKIQTETEREIADLKKELREKTLECEILKKAVGIFSKPNRKSSNL